VSARVWTLDIPAPAPWLNANGRRDRRRLAPVVRLWREAATVHARSAQLPMLGRARIVAELRFPDRRRRDDHNYFPTVKAIVDGLVDYGLLADDSREYLVGTEIRSGEPVKRLPYGPAGAVHLIISEVA
jgi:hypothetical protein